MQSDLLSNRLRRIIVLLIFFFQQTGICDGGFDTVYDWVRRRPDGQLIYNTYFFREDHYWMYENRHNRTRYGDPLKIVPEWKGIPARLDGFVHIWTYTQDVMYFFKGICLNGLTLTN